MPPLPPALAAALERLAAVPELLTLEFQKKNRRDRVFVDWLRNGLGATAVVPWSVRPHAGAPVAMPIAWEELSATEPTGWTITDARERISSGSWGDFDAAPASLDVAHPAVLKLMDTAGLQLEAFDRFRS